MSRLNPIRDPASPRASQPDGLTRADSRLELASSRPRQTSRPPSAFRDVLAGRVNALTTGVGPMLQDGQPSRSQRLVLQQPIQHQGQQFATPAHDPGPGRHRQDRGFEQPRLIRDVC
jgi:hypothetical protein